MNLPSSKDLFITLFDFAELVEPAATSSESGSFCESIFIVSGAKEIFKSDFVSFSSIAISSKSPWTLGETFVFGNPGPPIMRSF